MARTLIRSRQGISLQKIAATCLKPGEIIIDIGANEGKTALIFSACVGKKGSVYAIEPNPKLCGQLHHIEFPHNNVNIHETALGHTAGTFTFYIDTSPASWASSLSVQHVQRETEEHGLTFIPTKVKMTTLDIFCSDIAPGFIKVDVEGAEEEVIRGGIKTLKKHHPIVWFECWCGQKDGQPINKNLGHIEMLRALDYKIFVATTFKHMNKWGSSSLDPKMEKHFTLFSDEILHGPPVGMDLIAIPPSRVSYYQNMNLIN